MPFINQIDTATVRLTVYVQPRASRCRFAGLHGEAVKLCITAPPVDGKANKAVLAFLAKFLRLPKSTLSIIHGRQSRTKVVQITGCQAPQVINRLHQAVSG